MEELFKNSLLGQLQELGFASEDNKIREEVNPLAIKVDKDIEDSPFVDNPIKESLKDGAKEDAKENIKDAAKNSAQKILEENIEQKAEKKRLNDF